MVLFDSIKTKSFCLLIYSCLFVSEIIYVMVSIVGPIFSSTKRFHVWSHFPVVDTFTHMVISLTQISLHLMWSDAQHQCVSFGANVRAGCTHGSAQNCQIHVRIEEVENAQRDAINHSFTVGIKMCVWWNKKTSPSQLPCLTLLAPARYKCCNRNEIFKFE